MDQNLEKPLVSVLMPVYNAEEYIEKSIESILNQTYKNFEFIIVDDFSSDNSVKIICLFSDSRIRLITKNNNSGIAKTLNIGLENAKGKYIIRMDADDICHHNRIHKQVEFLENNEDYILCGSNYKTIDENIIVKLPQNNESIKLGLLSNCCIAHPTVAIRFNVLKQYNIHYDSIMEPAEDYDLWVSLASKGKYYNLQEELLYYRVHEEQISNKRKKEQDQKSFAVKIKYISSFYKKIIEKEEVILKKILLSSERITKEDVESFSKFIKSMKKNNESNSYFNKDEFNIFLSGLEELLLENYFAKYERYTISDIINYYKINREYGLKFSFKKKFGLFLKSVFFYKIKTR